MYPAHFHFEFEMRSNFVTFVLDLTMVFLILSVNLTLEIFISVAGLLVFSVFTVVSVRGHVWHLYVIVGKKQI